MNNEGEDKEKRRIEQEDGSIYEGEVDKDGKYQGIGKQVFADKRYYEGTFTQGVRNGYGQLRKPNGEQIYKGYWKYGQYFGYGWYKNENPVPMEEPFDFRDFDKLGDQWKTYDGEYAKNYRQGYGKIELMNGQQWEGTTHKDKVHGKGTYKTFDGTIIEAIWYKNKLTQIISKQLPQNGPQIDPGKPKFQSKFKIQDL